VAGVRRSAAEHRLPVEELSAAEVQVRFPAFDFRHAGEVVGVLEHTAGFLYVERCVRAMADEARRLGADLREDEPVLGWEHAGGGFAVRTPAGRHTAARLVLTAGPWAGRLLGEAGRVLTVMRQVALWHDSVRPELFR